MVTGMLRTWGMKFYPWTTGSRRWKAIERGRRI